MPARMRFPAQALEELRKADPETQVSLKLIRRLIHTGAVPSVPVGNGNRRLVNLDAGTVAVIVGFVVMCAMVTLAKKTGKQWVSDWSLTIAMVSGMVVTIPITLLS